MFFNSLDFAIFLAICLPLYFALYALGRHRLQNRLLLVASYVFYAAWDWRFCFLLALSSLVDFSVALAMQRGRRRRLLLAISLAVNLGLLGYFKYANFFLESLAGLLAVLGISLGGGWVEVILPVGISFYTFQTLSYTIDVYRGKFTPITNLFDYALYVSFFPQLVAGPIERASRLLPQILGRRTLSWDRFSSGAWLIFWGTFKKVVIADNLAPLVDMVYGPEAEPTSPELIFATYAFAFQIYCDFSGYTDIARGIARMMGFDLMLNFRLPYAATGPSDFWRRWHISLSTWLRDYLYISLGGNRGNKLSTYRNLMLTMLLGGLWHGAGWPFALWGAFHGTWLALHRLLGPTLSTIDPRGAPGRIAWHGVRILASFHLVCLGWMFFHAESLAHVGRLLTRLGGNFELGLVPDWIVPFSCLIAPLVLMQIAQARSDDPEVILRWPLGVRTAIYFVLGLMLVIMGEDGGQPFIYFQF